MFNYVFERLLLIGVVIVQVNLFKFLKSILEVINLFDQERFDVLRHCVCKMPGRTSGRHMY